MTDRAKFAPQCFPGRAFGAALRGAQFGRARECWEDLKKLLFFYVSQRAPAIALSRTVGSLFSANGLGRLPGPKIASNNADGGLQWASLEKSAKSFNSSQSR